MSSGYAVDPGELRGLGSRLQSVLNVLEDGRATFAHPDFGGNDLADAVRDFERRWTKAKKDVVNNIKCARVAIEETAQVYEETDNSLAQQMGGGKPGGSPAQSPTQTPTQSPPPPPGTGGGTGGGSGMSAAPPPPGSVDAGVAAGAAAGAAAGSTTVAPPPGSSGGTGGSSSDDHVFVPEPPKPGAVDPDFDATVPPVGVDPVGPVQQPGPDPVGPDQIWPDHPDGPDGVKGPAVIDLTPSLPEGFLDRPLSDIIPPALALALPAALLALPLRSFLSGNGSPTTDVASAGGLDPAANDELQQALDGAWNDALVTGPQPDALTNDAMAGAGGTAAAGAASALAGGGDPSPASASASADPGSTASDPWWERSATPSGSDAPSSASPPGDTAPTGSTPASAGGPALDTPAAPIDAPPSSSGAGSTSGGSAAGSGESWFSTLGPDASPEPAVVGASAPDPGASASAPPAGPPAEAAPNEVAGKAADLGLGAAAMAGAGGAAYGTNRLRGLVKDDGDGDADAPADDLFGGGPT